jgi:hypothetical protein
METMNVNQEKRDIDNFLRKVRERKHVSLFSNPNLKYDDSLKLGIHNNPTFGNPLKIR